MGVRARVRVGVRARVRVGVRARARARARVRVRVRVRATVVGALLWHVALPRQQQSAAGQLGGVPPQFF